jgi:hypothetical protein
MGAERISAFVWEEAEKIKYIGKIIRAIPSQR